MIHRSHFLSRLWIPRLFQRISLVKCLVYPSQAQTTEILWKSQGIHDLEHTEGSVYASLKWDLCIDGVKIHYDLYFHWIRIHFFLSTTIKLLKYSDDIIHTTIVPEIGQLLKVGAFIQKNPVKSHFCLFSGERF